MKSMSVELKVGTVVVVVAVREGAMVTGPGLQVGRSSWSLRGGLLAGLSLA